MRQRFGEVVTWLAVVRWSVAHQSSLLLTIAVSQPLCQGVAVKFCCLSFAKFLEWLPSPPSQFLIFCAWRASWLRIVATSGVNFSETVAAGAKFVLASESSASIFSREARSISNCRVYLTPD